MPEAEELVRDGEATWGEESFFNSLNRLRELIQRCSKKDKILWTMQSLADNFKSGKYAQHDISITTLKAGPKSVTDVTITTLALRNYLLGPWMDNKDFPPYIKKKAREIFANHNNWRSLWHPLSEGAPLDTNWIFAWPPASKELLDFVERPCMHQPRQRNMLTGRQ